MKTSNKTGHSTVLVLVLVLVLVPKVAWARHGPACPVAKILGQNHALWLLVECGFRDEITVPSTVLLIIPPMHAWMIRIGLRGQRARGIEHGIEYLQALVLSSIP